MFKVLSIRLLSLALFSSIFLTVNFTFALPGPKARVAIDRSAIERSKSGAVIQREGKYSTPYDVAPELRCTFQEVQGMVVKCCKKVGELPSYSNCTTYSREFNDICTKEGKKCQRVAIFCEGKETGHALNIIANPEGNWCFVEPQEIGLVEPCFPDPHNPPDDVLCKISGFGGSGPDCRCRATFLLGADTDNPKACTTNTKSKNDCDKCCMILDSDQRKPIERDRDYYLSIYVNQIKFCRSLYFNDLQSLNSCIEAAQNRFNKDMERADKEDEERTNFTNDCRKSCEETYGDNH